MWPGRSQDYEVRNSDISDKLSDISEILDLKSDTNLIESYVTNSYSSVMLLRD